MEDENAAGFFHKMARLALTIPRTLNRPVQAETGGAVDSI